MAFLVFPHMGITSPTGQMLEFLMPGFFFPKKLEIAIAHSSFPLYASYLLDINFSLCYGLDMKCLSCRLMC